MDDRSSRRRFRGLIWIGMAMAIGAAGALICGAVIWSHYERRAEAFDLRRLDQVSERSAIHDANGEFYSYFGGENRLVVPLGSVSKNFVDALIAREDSRFWRHGGVDFLGIARAFVTNIAARRIRQGASTITQQLARNAFGLEGRTIDRKLLEMALARRIEQHCSKSRILELYVNRIYFGCGFFGVEAASRGYFDKPAAHLTLGEAAVLAGLIRSPSKLAPVRDAEAATRERDAVIDRMVDTKVLAPADAAAAKAVVIHPQPSDKLEPARDYVMDAVMRELEQTLAPELLRKGGLRVDMTVDPQLQRIGEAAVDRHLAEIETRKDYAHPRRSEFASPRDGGKTTTDYLQGALVAIDNATGAIRAIVGGRDYSQSSYSRALLAKRPIGSTFKPFVYAAAFERGLLPGTLVDDSKIAENEFRNISNGWSPENSDDEYTGLQPAAEGLVKSRNTMSVRVGEYAGIPQVRELARQAGVAAEIPDLPGIFLGAFETTLKDLTAAYTIFPNLGQRSEPHLVEKVTDREGRVLFSAKSRGQRVLDSGTAWLVSKILQQVLVSGTAASARKLGWTKPGGGKTGTTNDYFDAWFVGYTSSLTCGVWTGFDKPQTIGPKAYGSALALPIWVDFMEHAPEGKYPTRPLRDAPDLQKATLCKVSGLRATNACVAQGQAYDTLLPAAKIPAATCRSHTAPAPQVAYSDLVPSTSYPANARPAPAPNPPSVPTVATAVPAPQPRPARPSRIVSVPSVDDTEEAPATPLPKPPDLGPPVATREAGAPVEVRRAAPIRSVHDPRAEAVQIEQDGQRSRMIIRVVPVRRAEAADPEEVE
jgi:penicillin-binding protein 1A